MTAASVFKPGIVQVTSEADMGNSFQVYDDLSAAAVQPAGGIVVADLTASRVGSGYGQGMGTKKAPRLAIQGGTYDQFIEHLIGQLRPALRSNVPQDRVPVVCQRFEEELRGSFCVAEHPDRAMSA